jgi:SAM-dependent methyltransferase
LASQQVKPLFGSKGGQHMLGGLIDHRETFGPHVVEGFVRSLSGLQVVVDLGAGSGRDLAIVRRFHPRATLIAVEGEKENAKNLAGKVDRVYLSNIERDSLPLADSEVDLIIANQFLEHTKEIFWIFHEVSRSLKLGGHFLFGVPNICSLHNRFLLLIGKPPTQHKVCSPHVRPFSKNDTLAFLNICFPGGYELAKFRGSQFYPFPARPARILADILPTFAFSIFFMIRKTKEYHNEFAVYPSRAGFETNFWSGEAAKEFQEHP